MPSLSSCRASNVVFIVFSCWGVSVRSDHGALQTDTHIAAFEAEDKLDLVPVDDLLLDLRGNPSLGGIGLPGARANLVEGRHCLAVEMGEQEAVPALLGEGGWGAVGAGVGRTPGVDSARPKKTPDRDGGGSPALTNSRNGREGEEDARHPRRGRTQQAGSGSWRGREGGRVV